MDAATILRTVRANSGWTQRELARRCGVAQPSLSDIETGDRDTTVTKLGQILRPSSYTVIPIPTAVPPIAEWAIHIASLLDSNPGAIRKTVVQIADDLAAADDFTKLVLCATPPAPTGSPALDALLAGIVEHCLTINGLPTPPWIDDSDRLLDEPWDLIEVPALKALARVSTPAAFRRRNLFVPADLFESI